LETILPNIIKIGLDQKNYSANKKGVKFFETCTCVSLFLRLVVCCVHVYGIFFCFYLARCFANLFTSGCFADDIRSLGIMQSLSSTVALPFTFPLLISHRKSSFPSTCPNRLRFLCHIVSLFSMLRSSLTFSRTDADLVTLSFQLVFSINSSNSDFEVI